MIISLQWVSCCLSPQCVDRDHPSNRAAQDGRLHCQQPFAVPTVPIHSCLGCSRASIGTSTRDFPFVGYQPAIVPKRTARFKRNDLSCRDSCLRGRSIVPILPLKPPGQRFRPVSAQRQPVLHSNHQRFARSQWSLTLHQRRRHTEPPNPLQDRCEQLTWHRDFGHLERHVLRMPNHFGPDLDQSRRQA